MNRASVAPGIIQELFDSAANAAHKGQAQFFTPTEFGKALARLLPAERPLIADLSCGNGQLLRACAGADSTLFGVDIDPCDAPQVRKLTGDATRVVPLLAQAGWDCPLFVLNPPWDLHWYRERLAWLNDSSVEAVRLAFAAHDGRTTRETIDATIASWCMALDRCTDQGEGLLIANEATLQRLVFAERAPHRALADTAWLHLVFPGNPMTNRKDCNRQEEFSCGVVYFSPTHTGGAVTMRDLDPTKLPADFEKLARQHGGVRHEAWHTRLAGEHCRVRWQGVREEWERRVANRPDWNIWMDGDKLRTNLSLFTQWTGKVDMYAANRLHQLNGKRPMQLVLQREQRDELRWATGPDSPWKVAPAVLDAVAGAIREYNAVRAPLYPLPRIQRLGYLDEEDTITCEQSFPCDGESSHPYVAGRSYPIHTRTMNVSWSDARPGMDGGMEDLILTGAELVVFIEDEDGQRRAFVDARRIDSAAAALQESGARLAAIHTLQQLVDHFQIPHVPDVAECRPAEYQQHMQTLNDLENICP